MPFGFEFVKGSGNIQTRDYDLKNFRAIHLGGSGSLSVQQTGEESIRVETDDNLFEYLRVELRGSELYLGTANLVSLHPTRGIKYYVTVRDIEAVSLAGSGEIMTSSLNADRLRFEMSGSGDLDTGALTVTSGFSLKISGSGKMDVQSVHSGEAGINITGSGKIRIPEISNRQTSIDISGSGDIRMQKLETERIQTRVSGSGDLEIAGKAAEQELVISSAGKYQCEFLESSRADIKISGAGSARVNVSERLDARISGSGSILYRGKPLVVMSISGAGKVKSLEQG